MDCQSNVHGFFPPTVARLTPLHRIHRCCLQTGGMHTGFKASRAVQRDPPWPNNRYTVLEKCGINTLMSRAEGATCSFKGSVWLVLAPTCRRQANPVQSLSDHGQYFSSHLHIVFNRWFSNVGHFAEGWKRTILTHLTAEPVLSNHNFCKKQDLIQKDALPS